MLKIKTSQILTQEMTLSVKILNRLFHKAIFKSNDNGIIIINGS
jgi:hypothetical protein